MRHLRACLIAATLTSTLPSPALGGQDATATDVNLVTALDLSNSMMRHEEWLEFEGLADAVESDLFLDALAAGRHGRAGFAVVVWSSGRSPQVIVPWTLIETRGDANRIAERLRAARGAHDFDRRMGGAGTLAPRNRRTDISTAIDFAATLLRGAPYTAARDVINICGNGVDNVGAPPDDARDRALAAGIVVNGLVIGDRRGIADHYRAHVQGGPGSFVLKVQAPGAIVDAMLEKLLRDLIAGGRWLRERLRLVFFPQEKGRPKPPLLRQSAAR